MRTGGQLLTIYYKDFKIMYGSGSAYGMEASSVYSIHNTRITFTNNKNRYSSTRYMYCVLF